MKFNVKKLKSDAEETLLVMGGFAAANKLDDIVSSKTEGTTKLLAKFAMALAPLAASQFVTQKQLAQALKGASVLTLFKLVNELTNLEQVPESIKANLNHFIPSISTASASVSGIGALSDFSDEDKALLQGFGNVISTPDMPTAPVQKNAVMDLI